MTKPKIGLYWCASCGGCEESVVDLAEHLLDVVAAVDIVFWPVALDFKYSDVEALADNELAVVLINGAIRMDDQADIARLLRRKSKMIIAHGACAHLGGVVGLGNFAGSDALLKRAYKEMPTLSAVALPKPESKMDGHTVDLPTMLPAALPLNAVIDVDYYLPGCPPTPELLLEAISHVLAGTLPPKGSVLGDSRALCDSCSRRDSKPEKLNLTGFRRVHQTELKPDRCFLEQGIVCLGPVTRGGCVERCLKGNMPCTGCFGPMDNVMDMGAKYATTLGSTIDLTDPAAVRAWVQSIPDPAGQLYRYSLAASALRGYNPREAQ